VKLICVIKTILLILILSLNCRVDAIAAWIGPSTPVQGAWGTGVTEFGYSKGEVKDSFPDEFHVLSDGRIAIYDITDRLKIFDKSGVFVKAIDKLGYGLFELGANKFIIAKWGQEKTNNFSESIGVYDLAQEKWLWVDRERWFSYAPQMVVSVADDSSFFIIWFATIGYKYSAEGKLLETFTKKPLEFGLNLSEQKLSDGNYQTVIKFNDVTYSCKTPTSLDPRSRSFARDQAGYLYGIAKVGALKKNSHTRIYKINKCGSVVATLDFPPNRNHGIVIRDPLPATDIVTVDEEYGQPVITPNGDVYTWKRTPDKYSILKWTWVDDAKLPKELCNEQSPAPRQ